MRKGEDMRWRLIYILQWKECTGFLFFKKTSGMRRDRREDLNRVKDKSHFLNTKKNKNNPILMENLKSNLSVFRQGTPGADTPLSADC